MDESISKRRVHAQSVMNSCLKLSRAESNLETWVQYKRNKHQDTKVYIMLSVSGQGPMTGYPVTVLPRFGVRAHSVVNL
jgi:hypothetical protein